MPRCVRGDFHALKLHDHGYLPVSSNRLATMESKRRPTDTWITRNQSVFRQGGAKTRWSELGASAQSRVDEAPRSPQTVLDMD